VRGQEEAHAESALAPLLAARLREETGLEPEPGADEEDEHVLAHHVLSVLQKVPVFTVPVKGGAAEGEDLGAPNWKLRPLEEVGTMIGADGGLISLTDLTASAAAAAAATSSDEEDDKDEDTQEAEAEAEAAVEAVLEPSVPLVSVSRRGGNQPSRAQTAPAEVAETVSRGSTLARLDQLALPDASTVEKRRSRTQASPASPLEFVELAKDSESRAQHRRRAKGRGGARQQQGAADASIRSPRSGREYDVFSPTPTWEVNSDGSSADGEAKEGAGGGGTDESGRLSSSSRASSPTAAYAREQTRATRRANSKAAAAAAVAAAVVAVPSPSPSPSPSPPPRTPPSSSPGARGAAAEAVGGGLGGREALVRVAAQGRRERKPGSRGGPRPRRPPATTPPGLWAGGQQQGQGGYLRAGEGLGGGRFRQPVGRAFPSWNRSILTEIYLCDACSDHEMIEDGNARAGGPVLGRASR
jgi:hypothetical protein